MSLEVPASAPQIRSRITVVCAECKRLKLKCDRRNPCGSCTKRDTVARCIYSAAAAEKVDLHSLNNRLIQVETMLAQITAGQFQPSYPSGSSLLGSTQPLTSSVSLSCTPANNHASIAIPLDDLVMTWLHDLNVPSSFLCSSSKRIKTSSSEVKQEPTPIQLSQLNISSKSNKTPVYLTLPPTSVYFLSSGDGTPDAQYPRVTKELFAMLSPLEHSKSFQNALGSPARHHPQSQSHPSSSKPHHTPPTCPLERILTLAEQALTFTHPWMNWKVFGERAQAFLTRSQERSHDEPDPQNRERELQREEKRERALQIFGLAQGRGQPQSVSPSYLQLGKRTNVVSGVQTDSRRQPGREVDSEGHDNVPFFAWLCIVIAVGLAAASEEEKAFCVPSGDMMDVDSCHSLPFAPHSPQADPIYWYHLSVQALGVWEAHRSPADDDDDMDIDMLSAMLIQIAFLVRKGLGPDEGPQAADEVEEEWNEQSKLTRTASGKVVVPLMGKVVATAHQLKLHVDPEDNGETTQEGSSRRKDKEKDGNGKSKEKEKEPVNGNPKRKKTFTLYQAEMRRRMWWCLLYYDLLISDISAVPPLVPLTNEAFSTQQPVFNVDDRVFSPSSTRIPPPEDGGSDGQSWSRHSMRALQAKCESVKIIRTTKARINSPRFGVGMSPGPGGYSIEQAALMEGEVKSWMGSLPAFWKGSVTNRYVDEEEDVDELMEDDQEPRRDEVREVELQPQANEDPILISQRCELAIVAHRLVLRIYLPFLQYRKGLNFPVPHQANLGSINAAHGVIAACQILSLHLKGVPSSSLFDLYPLGRTVFDAAVICAHAAIKQPLSILVKPALEDVDVALGMLKKCAREREPTAQGLLSDEYIIGTREAVRVVERLRRRAHEGGEGLLHAFPASQSHSPVSEGQSPSLKRKYHEDSDNTSSDEEGNPSRQSLTSPTSSVRVNPGYVYPVVPQLETSSPFTTTPTTINSATSNTSAHDLDFGHPVVDVPGNSHITGGEPVHSPPSEPPTAIPSKSPNHKTAVDKEHKKPPRKPTFGIRVRSPKDASTKPVIPPFTRAPQQQQPPPHPPFQPPVMSAVQEQHQQAYRSRSSSLSQPFVQGPPTVKQEPPISATEVASYSDISEASNPSSISRQRTSNGELYQRRDSLAHYSATPAPPPQPQQQPSQLPFPGSNGYESHSQSYPQHSQIYDAPRKESYDNGYSTGYHPNDSNPTYEGTTVLSNTPFNGTSTPFAPATAPSPAQAYYVPGFAAPVNNQNGEVSHRHDAGNVYTVESEYSPMVYEGKPTIELDYPPPPHQEVYYSENHNPVHLPPPSTSSPSSFAQANQRMMTTQTWAQNSGQYWGDSSDRGWNGS